jgi:hypothetical protein
MQIRLEVGAHKSEKCHMGGGEVSEKCLKNVMYYLKGSLARKIHLLKLESTALT